MATYNFRASAGNGTAKYADGMRVPNMDPTYLYRSPLHRPSVHSGTPYPCREEDLETYNRPMLEKSLPWVKGGPSREAVREIEQFLHDNKTLSKTEKAAIERLAEGMKVHKWDPDIFIKMFRDIDALFFMGRLTGSVSIEWVVDLKGWQKRIGFPTIKAATRYQGSKLSHIALNAWSIFFTPAAHLFSITWQVLLHEMVVRRRYFESRLMQIRVA
ncbi:MAG: hypothetical protein Q9214_004844 [Letrouitia sp. 1 TL-2023]